MHLSDVLILLTIGHTLVIASVIPSVIEVSSRNISDYSPVDDTTQPRLTSCTSGTFLVPESDHEEKDTCVPCPLGQFMSEEHHTSKQCRPCHTPDRTLGEVEGEPCNSTRDTTVVCLVDYFLQGNRCAHCRLCSFNDSRNACVTACCRARFNVTGDSNVNGCERSWELDNGNNDWRIIFLVGLLGITLFSFFVCVWRGVFKSGNRTGKAGCIRYKRVRTLSNSMSI